VSAGTDDLAAHPGLPLLPHHGQALPALLDSASIPVKLRAGPSPRAVASASESESESTSASRTSSTAHSSTEGSESSGDEEIDAGTGGKELDRDAPMRGEPAVVAQYPPGSLARTDSGPPGLSSGRPEADPACCVVTDLTEYEAARLQNIARNMAKMRELGIDPGAAALPVSARRRECAAADAAPSSEPVRRSTRVRSAKPGESQAANPACAALLLKASIPSMVAPSECTGAAEEQQPALGRDRTARPTHQVSPRSQPEPEPTALKLRRGVASGLLCGICKFELFDTDACLECTSWQPRCERQYHVACVRAQFGHMYTGQQLQCPQPRKSTWRCMACSNVCATCVPAAWIKPFQAFYRCGFCGAEAHQHHWSADDSKQCFYCRLPM
jgi:hypothetical protein